MYSKGIQRQSPALSKEAIWLSAVIVFGVVGFLCVVIGLQYIVYVYTTIIHHSNVELCGAVDDELAVACEDYGDLFVL